MSFFEVGDKFGVSQANLMKKLGFGDTSPGGNGEVRLFKDDADYILKVWNGGSWDSIGQVDILKKDGVARVTATTSGADINGNLIISGSLSVNGEIHTPAASPGTKAFTESGIFTVPSGVTTLRVTLVAGGGGGGKGYHGNGANSGSGGGAGEYHERATVNVTPGEQILVTIGKGGRGNKWPQNNMAHAEKGGDSSFGSYIKVNGGFPGGMGWKGGDGGTSKGDYTGGATNNNGLNITFYSTPLGGTLCTGAGGGGSANGGDTTHGGNGGNDTHRGTTGGTHGSGTGSYYGSGAGGGAGYGGNGGAGGNRTSATGASQTHLAAYDGHNGLGYGAGGGGGANGVYPMYNFGHGGNGYDGYCLIEWLYS